MKGPLEQQLAEWSGDGIQRACTNLWDDSGLNPRLSGADVARNKCVHFCDCREVKPRDWTSSLWDSSQVLNRQTAILQLLLLPDWNNTRKSSKCDSEWKTQRWRFRETGLPKMISHTWVSHFHLAKPVSSKTISYCEAGSLLERKNKNKCRVGRPEGLLPWRNL